MKIYLGLFIVVFAFAGQLAQASNFQEEDSLSIRDTQTNLEPILFDKQKIESYKKDPAFDYKENNQGMEWWTAFKRKLANLWNSLWENILGTWTPGSWLGTALKILQYVLIIGFLVFLVWLFLRLNPGQLLFEPSKQPKVFLTEEEKILQTENITELIEKALKEGDYRLAVRYSFLKVLKKLREKELIAYSPDKTNHQYLQELQPSELQINFKNLIRYYEYSWYGDFQIDENQYRQAAREFKQMNSQLNT